MELVLSIGERMAVQWLLLSSEGYDLDGARHQRRVMAKLELAGIGNKSLAELHEAEAVRQIFPLEQPDVVWLRDQIRKRFEAKTFNPMTAAYGADLLDLLDQALAKGNPQAP